MPIVGLEPKNLSTLVKHEYAGVRGYCRKMVSFKNAANTDLAFGTVLGKRLVGGAAAAVAGASNVGDGAMGAITVADGTAPGNYVLTVTSESSDAGGFEVSGPNGALVGTGNVDAAFSGGGLSFTLADGAEDFDTGDTFVITVTGTYEYDVLTNTASDGTAVPAGIYIGKINGTFGVDYEDITANTATNVIALVQGPAVVGKAELVLDASVNSDAEKQAVYDGLEALGIVVADQL